MLRVRFRVYTYIDRYNKGVAIEMFRYGTVLPIPGAAPTEVEGMYIV